MSQKEIQIGYRDLAKVSGRSISQLRRYVLTLLGINPEVGRQSGLAREFSLTEVFAVYFMGVLVDDYGFTLQEAKKHVWKILWNVGRDGPEADLTDLGYLRPPIGWESGFPVAGVLLRIYPGPRPVYEFRVFKEIPEPVEDWEKYTQERTETYTSYWLPKAAMANEGTGTTPGMIYELSLLAHLRYYLAAVRALGF